MKKPKKKQPAKAPKKKADPAQESIRQAVAGLDEAALREFLSMFSDAGFGPPDTVELFSEYLEACQEGDLDDEERAELMDELVGALDQLRVDANGGSREAREQMKEIFSLLDNAIAENTLAPVDLMMTGKVFSDSGWETPESLKHALARALESGPVDESGAGGSDLVTSMLTLVQEAEFDAFELYEHVNSLLAGFPAEASVMLIGGLVGGDRPIINAGLAGFLLHKNREIARATAEALAASSKRAPVESALVERLLLMRPWLAPERQAFLDTAVKAMRLNAQPPAKREQASTPECLVSVRDGSGAQSLFVSQKLRSRFGVVIVMTKSVGVAEAVVMADLPKAALNEIVGQMKASVPMMKTDIAGLARVLALALADNLKSGSPPPFKLVQAVECLGLGHVHPDHSSSAEILDGLLADLPEEQTAPDAVAKAHAELSDSCFMDQWFEAGEALDEALGPVKGEQRRIAKMLKDYLPARRDFWARQCALTALAMRSEDCKLRPTWIEVALVGRDVAGDTPIEEMPFMKRVAEASVEAFEAQL